MPIKGFRLGSIVAHGVGGLEAGAIDLIYAFMLHEFEQDFYSVMINQIGAGTDPDEIIIKGPGNNIHINIRYPVLDDFENRTTAEKNQYQLNLIHTALYKIADYDKKLDKEKLDAIKNKILQKNFLFEFHLKKFIYPKNKNLVARLVVEPLMDRFIYYIIIELNSEQTHKINIYEGGTDTYYSTFFFQKGKWKNENHLIITGKENVVETHILLNENKAEFVNLTPYEKPPIFEMMKAKAVKSKEESDKAYNDWIHSLPPSVAAIVTQEFNLQRQQNNES